MGSNRKAKRVRTAAGHGFLDTNRIQGEGASFRRLSVWQSYLSRGLPTELQICGTVRRYTWLSEGVPPVQTVMCFFQIYARVSVMYTQAISTGKKNDMSVVLHAWTAFMMVSIKSNSALKWLMFLASKKSGRGNMKRVENMGTSRRWEVPSQPV